MSVHVCDDGFVRENNQTVGNVFLSKIEYNHTVENMVTKYFPSGKYTLCDSDTITDIPDIEKGGILVIQGQKGFGKSKAIRMLRDTYFSDKSIVHINFSRSLSYFSAVKRGKGVHHYAADDEPITADLLEVVINSIGRVKRPYDVVVIDEVVSVMSSVSGSLITDTHRMNVLNCLRKLLISAKYVVIADAFIEPVTVHFIHTLRGVWSPLNFLDYTHRPQSGHTCVVYKTKQEWKSSLMRAVRSGLRVVVPCMYRYLVNLLKGDIVSACPGVSVQAYYDGPGSDDTSAAMKNISVWKKCQVLIYSPCITAGCSFEEKHFDTQYFYGVSSAHTGNVQSALQMTSRVRDIAHKNIHVYIDDTYFGPDEPQDLILPPSIPTNPMSVLGAAVTCVRLFNIRSFRSKVRGFAYEFFQHKVDAGFDIVYANGPSSFVPNNYICAMKSLRVPAPPFRADSPDMDDLLEHINMSDIERGVGKMGHLFPLLDADAKKEYCKHSISDDRHVLRFHETYCEIKDTETLEEWGRLMTLYFLRTYYNRCDVVHKFCFLTSKFDNFDTETTLRSNVQIYMRRADERTTFGGRLADIVWAIASATIAHRKGRRINRTTAYAKFPGNRRNALTIVRHAGYLLMAKIQKYTKEGKDVHVVTNLPSVCSKKEESQMVPHFIMNVIAPADNGNDKNGESLKRKMTNTDHKSDNETQTHLYLLVWDDPHGHQLKNDFLRLFCQAAQLKTMSPYMPTHLECLHMGTSKSWNVPFYVTCVDSLSIVTMMREQTCITIRARVGVLEIDYTFGVLNCKYWPHCKFNNGKLFYYDIHTIDDLTELINGIVEEDVYVVGFDIQDPLFEIYEGNYDMLDKVQKFYDMRSMIQVLCDEELSDMIRHRDMFMGLGYHVPGNDMYSSTDIDKFIDAFVDVKQSKGITYMLPNGTLVSVKCGDILCIGDCVSIFGHTGNIN